MSEDPKVPGKRQRTPRRQCAATSKTTGQRCEQQPRRDQEVCRFHGGSSPQAKAAALRRQAERRVHAELVKLGIPVELDPLDALMGQVYEAAGNVAFLRQKVQELDCLWYSYAGHATASDADDAEPYSIVKVELHVMVRFYNQERDRLARVSKLCVEAGVAERQVHLAEKQGALMADVIRRLLEDPELGLNADQRQKGLVVASRHLSLIS